MMPPAVSQVSAAVFAHLPLAAEQTFWQSHGDEISAAITVIVAILVALVVDRLLIGRGTRVAEKMTESGVSRAAHTRLRVVRRLIFVTILIIGIALALSQFAGIKRLATGILASSAVLGLVIGFAARQTLGNMVAGVMLAVSQPIRIGDRVTFEEVTGRVDDVTLSYTYLDPGNGDLVVVPNERMVSGLMVNHSTGRRGAPVTASAWVPIGIDLARARETIKREIGAESVQVAEWTPEAIRLEVILAPSGDRTRSGDEERALGERTQRALHDAGLLP